MDQKYQDHDASLIKSSTESIKLLSKNTPSNFLSNTVFQKEYATNLHEKVIDICKANLQNNIATEVIECVSINQIYKELNHYRNKNNIFK